MTWREALNWRTELGRIVEAVPPEQLADAYGELARLTALVWQRLNGASQNGAHAPPADGDSLLTVEEVKTKLNVKSDRWVQRHYKEMGGFKVGRLIRVPASGVEAYKKRQRQRER